MFNLFKSKDLKSVLNETKKVKVRGVIFKIKKLSSMDYLNGSDALRGIYDTYKTTKGNEESLDPGMHKKMVKHLTDVFMSAVISPKLTRKDDGVSVCIDELFNDWDMVNALYEQIINYTYNTGKKKVMALV